MEQVMAGHDVLVVLLTGAGKSAIYQVPPPLLDGSTPVVSLLIALQHDGQQRSTRSGAASPGLADVYVGSRAL
ncbi:hypothetical protein [Amycolatopsis sp. NPDC051061]|uniref:hypothetical protein n=1 Tax=Amycolatopsis sp. NPDC051061 TaxID=3155042 RepID=UPI00344985A0